MFVNYRHTWTLVHETANVNKSCEYLEGYIWGTHLLEASLNNAAILGVREQNCHFSCKNDI